MQPRHRVLVPHGRLEVLGAGGIAIVRKRHCRADPHVDIAIPYRLPQQAGYARVARTTQRHRRHRPGIVIDMATQNRLGDLLRGAVAQAQ